MNGALRALGAFSLGVGAMYLLDPDRGRRRRALVRDKAISLTGRSGEALGKAGRDLSNRTRGIIHEVGAAFRSEEVADDAIVERVRARLGRVVSHPRVIDVTCRNGEVTLRGLILERELNALLRTVGRSGGVRGIRNELEVHASADIEELRGGRRRPGNRIDMAQEHWAPATRLLAGISGGALALAATRASGPVGAAMAIAGGALLARSATNIELARMIGLGEDDSLHEEPTAATTRREALLEME